MNRRALERTPGSALGLFLLVTLWSCGEATDGATQIVDAAIERHGGALFEDSRISFGYRGALFEMVLDGGSFRYERSYLDPEGRLVTEGMGNDGTWMSVDGEPSPLDSAERTRVEEAVNSVVYFGFLPFRLRDPAVRLRDLGDDQIAGEPYHRIEVTFHEDGGGDDWEDRFVHWLHRDDQTLDYFAYRYYRNDGGTRFRRAINRREVGGLLLQDQENYRSIDPIADIADYGRLFDAGEVELVSLIELEEPRVERVGEAGSR